MPKQSWIKVGATWHKAVNVWKNIDGVWKQNVIPNGNIGGIWKDFMFYLPSNYLYSAGATRVRWGQGYISGSGGRTVVNSDHLLLEFTGALGQVGITTYDRVNLEGYKEINMEFEPETGIESVSLAASVIFGASISNSEVSSTQIVSSTASAILKMDVTGLGEGFYVQCIAKVTHDPSIVNRSVKIKRVWLT